MRVIKSLAALCFLALGLVFGALNTQHVVVDLGVRLVEGRLGPILLGALLGGAFIGGLVVTASVVWPMRRRLHRQRGAGSASGPDAQDLADRARPTLNPIAATLGPSFPSGHSASAAAFAVGVARLQRERQRDQENDDESRRQPEACDAEDVFHEITSEGRKAIVKQWPGQCTRRSRARRGASRGRRRRLTSRRSIIWRATTIPSDMC